jgi:uncharacterized membrane protein (DUF2068 family)
MKSERLVVFIGLIKLAKAAVVVAIGVATLVELPQQLATIVDRIIALTGGFPGRTSLHQASQRLSSLDASVVKRLGVLALAYAAIFTVEGIGLLLKRTWAEWLTIVVTASFIPLEIYELVVHFGLGKLAVLIANAAIVIYLIGRRARALRAHRSIGATHPPPDGATHPRRT